MTADNSDRWTCKNCGVTFTRSGFVRHVRADVCNVRHHVGQLVQTLGVFDHLLHDDNGRAGAFAHASYRRRR